MAARTHELLDGGRIGELRSVAGFFSYFLDDPANIRNHMEPGGGGLDGYWLLPDPRLALRVQSRSPAGWWALSIAIPR